MSLFGKRDTFAITGTVTVETNSNTIVGSGTAFTTELVPGSTVVISTVKYKVGNIANTTQLDLTEVYAGANASGASITGQDVPKYIPEGNLADIFFVDTTEASVAANRAKGLTSPGWWKYTTHTTDGGATTKHKAELLNLMAVAAGTSGDAGDDATVADS